MPVTGANVVDAVGIDNETGQVVLTLVDHLSWGDPEHLEALQVKLNAYLAFVESDELFEVYPQAQGRSVGIQVVCKHSPDATGVQFLRNADATIRNAGFDFSWRILET